MPKGSEAAAEIHRRLDAGEPVAHIARETGRQLSVVYHHRKGRCRCPENTPVAPETSPETTVEPELVPAIDPVEVATGAYFAGMSVVAIGSALGVETVNPDRLDFGLGDADISTARLAALQAETDALVRMRREHPGQWAVVQGRRAEVERKIREKGTAVLGHEDFVDFIRHLMRRIETTFLGPVRDRALDRWDLTVFIHDLISVKYQHMMLGYTDDQRLQVLVPWESDQPGMVASWELATDGVERCSKGCGSLAIWTLEGRPYCDRCVLELLWRTGVIESVHEGAYVHDTVYRGIIVSNEPGEETIVCIPCYTKEDYPSGGPNLKGSEIAPAVECSRCGTALPIRAED